MSDVSQKELRETFEDVESSKLFYEPHRYTSHPPAHPDVSIGVCYEDLLPPNVLALRRGRVRRCA